MTFSQFLTVLRARWLTGTALFVVVVAIALAGSLLWPKSYTSSASVLVDTKGADPITGPMYNQMVSPGYLATQVDLVQSERVARKAITSLRLLENAQLRSEWIEATKGVGDYAAWLAGVMGRKLEVKPGRESNVITVSFTSQDPAFSAAVANAYVRGYLQTTLELRTEPARQYSNFFDDRAKKFREDVEAAQNRLSAYQRDRGIVGLDDRLDVETMRYTEISSQVVALETAAAEASSRMGQAGSTPDRMQEVLSNPVVSTLQSDLSRQEARMQELTTRLGEANPQVIEAKNSIAELRSKLRAATERASGSVSVNSNVAQSRLASLRAAREEQRQKMLKLKSSRDEMAVLQRDVENAQRAYDAVIARGTQTALESQLTNTNVSVVKEATPSPEPSFPIIPLNLAIAVIVGIVVGIATILLRELMDPRLRTVDDVVQTLKQPLLIVMPKPAGTKKRLSEAARQAEMRLNGQREPNLAVR